MQCGICDLGIDLLQERNIERKQAVNNHTAAMVVMWRSMCRGAGWGVSAVGVVGARIGVGDVEKFHLDRRLGPRTPLKEWLIRLYLRRLELHEACAETRRLVNPKPERRRGWRPLNPTSALMGVSPSSVESLAPSM